MFDDTFINTARLTLGLTTDAALLLAFALLLGRVERTMRKRGEPQAGSGF